MRGVAAILAALALAALLASGCGLVDSLSPFGLGTQDYGAGNLNVNGIWAGATDNGGAVAFQVGSDKLTELAVTHVAGSCTLPFGARSLEVPVVDGVFTVELPQTQGRFVITGRFTSAASCSGTYFYEALPAGACPTAATGTFTAEKTSI